MNSKMDYILKGIKVLLIIVGVGLTMSTLSNWNSEWGEGTAVNGLEILKNHPELDSPLSGIVMLCVALIAITFLIMFLAWVFKLVTDIKGGLASIAGVVAVVVICLIAYNVMATDEVLSSWSISEKDGITPEISKQSGAGIYVAYIMGVIAIGAIIFTEVKSLIK